MSTNTAQKPSETTPAPESFPGAAAPRRKSTAKKPALPKPAAVLAYLRSNPAFFEKYKDELTQVAVNPKKGRMGGNILSLHAAKAERISRDAENLKIRHKQLISTARGNAEIADNIFNVIINLIGCRSLTELRKYLQTGLPEQLDLEAVRLFKTGAEETATTLTPEQIQSLCPQQLVLGPMHAATHRQLFGPKTNTLKSVCLMALTTENGTLHGLLALGSADETRFHAGQATTLADFLRKAATAVLAHAA